MTPIRNELTQDELAALDDVFSYHAPNETQREQYVVLRNEAKLFARRIMELVPPSADRTVALRCVREAVMNANAAIALDGRGLR